MFFSNINYWTIIISAVASMGLGFLWYSPVLFAKRWMKEMNYNPEELAKLKEKNGPTGMVKTYSMGVVVALITAFIFSGLLNSLIITGFGGLLCVAFSMWIGFSMPIALNGVLYGKDSLMLFAINSGYQLVSFIVIAFIVGIFG